MVWSSRCQVECWNIHFGQEWKLMWGISVRPVAPARMTHLHGSLWIVLALCPRQSLVISSCKLCYLSCGKSQCQPLQRLWLSFSLPLGHPKWCKLTKEQIPTNSLSKTFQQTLQFLGISHLVTSLYHPESQGPLELWHQILKSMLRKYCHDTEDWDKGLPFLLFAICDATQESLGFSPAELVFGHNLPGPLKCWRSGLCQNPLKRLMYWILECRCRASAPCHLVG